MHTPIRIFYCYASEDRRLLKKLEKHLSPLKNTTEIISWYDQEIQGGMDWMKEIENHLNAADIILLLISSDFIASDLCYSVQMKRALEKQKEGEVKVIPIILRPTLWRNTPIGNLQGLPKNNKAITEWRNRDTALLDVVIDLWVLIRDMPYEKIEWKWRTEQGNVSEIVILEQTISSYKDRLQEENLSQFEKFDLERKILEARIKLNEISTLAAEKKLVEWGKLGTEQRRLLTTLQDQPNELSTQLYELRDNMEEWLRYISYKYASLKMLIPDVTDKYVFYQIRDNTSDSKGSKIALPRTQTLEEVIDAKMIRKIQRHTMRIFWYDKGEQLLSWGRKLKVVRPF